MIRKSSWKQDTPLEQLVMLLQSAQGQLMNMQMGIGSPANQMATMEQNLSDCQDILRNLPENLSSWEMKRR